MVAAHQVQPTVEQQNQIFDVFSLAQRQVSKIKVNLFWLN
jgi:hypothetical protein